MEIFLCYNTCSCCWSYQCCFLKERGGLKMDDEGPGAEYPYFFIFPECFLLEIRIYKKKILSGGKRD